MGQRSATEHLQTLEAAVGDKLVERHGRSSRLTEAGEVVAAHAQRVLDTLDGMQEELRALHGAERGMLALAASTTPGSYVLPSILRCFAERHPRVGVDVVIESSEWVGVRVARREVQLGLAGELDLPDGVVAEPFLDDEVVGIAAPGRLKVRRGRVPVAALADTTLLVREHGSSPAQSRSASSPEPATARPSAGNSTPTRRSSARSPPASASASYPTSSASGSMVPSRGAARSSCCARTAAIPRRRSGHSSRRCARAARRASQAARWRRHRSDAGSRRFHLSAAAAHSAPQRRPGMGARPAVPRRPRRERRTDRPRRRPLPGRVGRRARSSPAPGRTTSGASP
jgi:DNA-binding transcriptional LysR family regulator